MLTLANGLESVPSPLKWMPSTIAFGCATPPTTFHPWASNTYNPCRVLAPQVGGDVCAWALSEVPNVIATMLISAPAKSKELVIFLIVSLEIHSCSLCLVLVFWD